jgi:hypothetical protein
MKLFFSLINITWNKFFLMYLIVLVFETIRFLNKQNETICFLNKTIWNDPFYEKPYLKGLVFRTKKFWTSFLDSQINLPKTEQESFQKAS